MRRSCGEVRRRDPQAEDVRAVLVGDGLRQDHVADRLRHLVAFAVEHEAGGQHLVVRRAAARGAAFQQRRLEPAAMLVRAFEIEIGVILLRPFRFERLLDREHMRRAGIEPDIENVLHLLVVFGIVLVAEEARGGVRLEPRIRAFGLEGIDDARVDLGIVEDLVGLLVRRRSRAARPRRAGATAPSRGDPSPCPRCGSRPTADTISCRRWLSCARSRSVPPPGISLSIAANHCGVARKITGAFERHECG